MRLILFLLLTIPVAGAQQASPRKPASSSPWFKARTINFAALTPTPPTPGSELDQKDLEEVLRVQQTRTPAQIQQAQADDKEEDIFIFASVLGPKFSATELPLAASLSQHLREASSAVNPPLKLRFGRPRPFVASTQVQPVCEKTASSSFPSGHSMVGTLEALALTQIVPERSPEILNRLDQYTHNRIVCGVHYPSDVSASRIVASVLFGLIAASPDFQKELASARAEIRSHLILPISLTVPALAQGYLRADSVSLGSPSAVFKEEDNARSEGLMR